MTKPLTKEEIAAMIAMSDELLAGIQKKAKTARQPFNKGPKGYQRRKVRRAAIRAKMAWLDT